MNSKVGKLMSLLVYGPSCIPTKWMKDKKLKRSARVSPKELLRTTYHLMTKKTVFLGGMFIIEV